VVREPLISLPLLRPRTWSDAGNRRGRLTSNHTTAFCTANLTARAGSSPVRTVHSESAFPADSRPTTALPCVSQHLMVKASPGCWTGGGFEDISSGRLRRLLAGHEASGEQTYIIFPSRRHLAPRTRVVIDFIAEQIKELDHQLEQSSRKPARS
jgi:DNA-binding transcriptional LysR family regulator